MHPDLVSRFAFYNARKIIRRPVASDKLFSALYSNTWKVSNGSAGFSYHRTGKRFSLEKDLPKSLKIRRPDFLAKKIISKMNTFLELISSSFNLQETPYCSPARSELVLCAWDESKKKRLEAREDHFVAIWD